MDSYLNTAALLTSYKSGKYQQLVDYCVTECFQYQLLLWMQLILETCVIYRKKITDLIAI